MSCPICDGFMWVCENHADKVWDTSAGGCECGAGMPCKCNPDGAIGPSMDEIIADVSMPDAEPRRTLQ